MSHAIAEDEDCCLGLRKSIKRLRFRRKSKNTRHDVGAGRGGNVTTTSLGSNAKHEIIVTSSKGDDNPKKFESTPFPDEAELDLKLEASATEGPGIDIEELDDLPSDLWSAAYRDAVINFGKGVNVAILKGENVAELFKQLEKLEKDATQESAFLRGVKYLQSLQVPLERFKLALDLASPLTSMEPTTATVCGVVKGVTAIAISFSTADLNFAKQIGEMLQQLSYIDDCDTLGQATDKKGIHNALVQVYGKLLEFYNAAFEMLTKKGAKLVMTLVLNNGRLPSIVSDFMIHAENLRKRVESATLEIVNEIKNMLFDVEIARWLGSEKISRQGQHHAYLQELRSDQACEFLLKDDSFIKWYQATGRESRQLVILGNMGSGKSVSMAFLIDELRRRNEHQLPQPRICYHYCQNDGSGQAVYIFSSLILSLLEQLPGLKKGFFEWYKRTTASGINPATNFKELEEWLGGAMDGMDRHIFFAIDGLDECDRQSRNHVLKSFRKLTEKAPGLRVLLSSRPEEEIVEQLSGVSTIAMPSDAVRDRFIVEKTVEHRLCYLASDVKELVTDTLSRGAQGSAIWTKMTVDLIEVRGIKAFGPMKAFLDEIPQSGKLAELYTKLFSRYTLEDPESQRLATTALEVLAAARRPLSMLELAWAVTLDTAQEAVPDVDTLAKLVDHQRIMSLIQPFVVHVDFHDLKKRQVKLAHQSVKEFVINHWASHRPGSQSGDTPALPSTGQPLFQDRIESLEAGLLGICIKYLLLKPVDDVELFSEEYMAILELPQDPFVFTEDNEPNNYDHYCSWETWEEDMIHFDPTERGFGELFVYASCLWTEHFATIPAESLLSPLEDIERLCKAGSTRLRNWTTQNCRPDCAIRPRFDFDSTLYDPLGVTSIYGSTAMFQHLLGHSDFSKSSFLPNPAMAASDLILQNGDLMRIRPLWESKVGHQIKNGAFFHLALKRWASYTFQKSRPGWDMVFSLIDDVLDKMVNERWGNELLTMAVKSGCMPLIQLLLDRAQHHSELRTELLSEVRSANSLLGEAVLGDYVEILEYLLQQQGIEPQLQHSNSDGQNALHLASKHRNPTVYRLLAPRMREMIHQQDDNNGDTPVILLITSPSDRGDLYESVQILLSEAEESEAGWGEDEMHEAVRVAAAVGDKKMCHLLMSYGTPLFLKVRQTT